MGFVHEKIRFCYGYDYHNSFTSVFFLRPFSIHLWKYWSIFFVDFYTHDCDCNDMRKMTRTSEGRAMKMERRRNEKTNLRFILNSVLWIRIWKSHFWWSSRIGHRRGDDWGLFHFHVLLKNQKSEISRKKKTNVLWGNRNGMVVRIIFFYSLLFAENDNKIKILG